MASNPEALEFDSAGAHCRALRTVRLDWNGNVVPIRSCALQHPAPAPAGTILFTTDSLICISMDAASLMIAPQRALWIPRGCMFSVGAQTRGTWHALAIPDDADQGELPDRPCLVGAEPLLRELLVEAHRLALETVQSPRRKWVMSLIVSAILDPPHGIEAIVSPKDTRLLQICNAILADPSDNRTIDEWSRIVGMSRRSLTRQFRLETQMSFAVWRQQVRLQQALARLRMGESVTRVAYEVGYESVSTFSTIFRQNFGTSPSLYMKHAC